MNKKGVLDYLLQEKKVELSVLTEKFSANEGYLNVALRILCSQGWLTQYLDNIKNTISYEVNEKSETAFKLAHLYTDALDLLSYSVNFPDERIGSDAFSVLERIFIKYEDNYKLGDVAKDSIEHQILKHIEGVIVAPIIVMLGVNGLFHKYFMEASFRAQEFHKNPESFKKILDFFAYLGWFIKKKMTLIDLHTKVYFSPNELVPMVLLFRIYQPLFN